MLASYRHPWNLFKTGAYNRTYWLARPDLRSAANVWMLMVEDSNISNHRNSNTGKESNIGAELLNRQLKAFNHLHSITGWRYPYKFFFRLLNPAKLWLRMFEHAKVWISHSNIGSQTSVLWCIIPDRHHMVAYARLFQVADVPMNWYDYPIPFKTSLKCGILETCLKQVLFLNHLGVSKLLLHIMLQKSKTKRENKIYYNCNFLTERITEAR